MLLTPGSLLQQDRYWIEAVLQQDDTAVSYRALHRNLDRHVVIQTLGRKLSQHPQVEQLRHEFLCQVRQQSQQSQQPGSLFRVIDCFVEGNTPFVVLDVADDQSLPVMSQWIPNLFTVLEEERQAIADAAVTLDRPTALETPVPAIGEPERHEGDRPSRHNPPSPPAVATPAPTTEPPTTWEQTVAVSGNGASTNGNSPATSGNATKTKTHVLVQKAKQQSLSRSKRSPWIPVSLLLTAIVGGCGGAYLGWQVRQGHSFADVVPVVGPKINTEQDFPPLEDWPSQPGRLAEEAETFGGSPGTERSRMGTPQNSPTAAAETEEDVWVEPYSIDYEPGQETLPYNEESEFPTQETRSLPDTPGNLDADAPSWEGEDYTPTPTAPVEPVPVPDSSAVSPSDVEEDPKDKLEALPGLPQTPQPEERSLPPRSQTIPQQPTDPIFPGDIVTPQ